MTLSVSGPPHSRASLLAQGAAMLVLSSIVRGLGALAALGVAYHAGTGLEMDYYIAMNAVVSTIAAIASAALPGIVQQRSAGAQGMLDVLGRCNTLVQAVERLTLGVMVVGVPILAWLLVPDSPSASPSRLAGLLVLAGLSAVLAPRIAAHQVVLQVAGRPLTGLLCTGLSTGACLVGAVLCAATGSMELAAAGLSVGALFELGLLRKLTGVAGRPAPSETALPWKSLVSLTGASSAILVCGFYDHWILAALGQGAQATWGLAGRAPSFLSLSVFAMAGALSSLLLPGWLEKSPAAVAQGATKLFSLVVLASAITLAALAVLAHPLTAVLYERGAFTAADTARVASSTQVLVLAYLFYPASVVLVRACGVSGSHRALGLSAVAFVLVKAVFALPLATAFRLDGLACSTLMAGAAQCGVLLLSLRSLK